MAKEIIFKPKTIEPIIIPSTIGITQDFARQKQFEVKEVEEAKSRFQEAERRLQKRLNQPIFKKGGVRTGLGKPIKKKVNIGRATKALRQLI